MAQRRADGIDPGQHMGSLELKQRTLHLQLILMEARERAGTEDIRGAIVIARCAASVACATPRSFSFTLFANWLAHSSTY